MNLRTTTPVLGLIGMLIGSSMVLGQSPPPPTQPPGEDVSKKGAPRLELSTEEWDFGMKWYGEPCSTDITISNTGDAPLKILKIRSSCGCTAAKPKRKELLPGESDKITLTYNTKKNREDVTQTITLMTNDPERPRVSIQIKGIVKKVYDAKPANRITFGRVSRDEKATQSIELRNNMDEEVVLKLKPFDEPPPFEITLEEVEPGRFYKLSATTKPPLRLGANAANVVLETGLDKFPSLTIPVSAYIAPRVYVKPTRLFVSPQVTQKTQRLVRVHYRSDQPIKIKEIKSSHPELIKVEQMPPRKPANPKAVTRLHEFRVTLPAGADFPEGGGRIEIYTDDPSPDYNKLVIEVRLQKTMPRALKPTEGKSITAQPTAKPKEGPAKPEGKTETDAP